jgi:hypothetical protein
MSCSQEHDYSSINVNACDLYDCGHFVPMTIDVTRHMIVDMIT